MYECCTQKQSLIHVILFLNFILFIYFFYFFSVFALCERGSWKVSRYIEGLGNSIQATIQSEAISIIYRRGSCKAKTQLVSLFRRISLIRSLFSLNSLSHSECFFFFPSFLIYLFQCVYIYTHIHLYIYLIPSSKRSKSKTRKSRRTMIYIINLLITKLYIHLWIYMCIYIYTFLS